MTIQARDRLRSAVQIIQPGVLIRSVRGTVWTGEAEQQGVGAKHLLERGQDGQRATLANERGLAVERFLSLPLPDDTRRRILWDTCARLCGIDG